MRVFLAGATGVIGRRLALLLRDAGFDVTVPRGIRLELPGRGTWYDATPKLPAIHVDAAAHAALLAVDKGNGVYNVAEDGGAVSSAKAARELGFDPVFRMPARLAQELDGLS